MMLDPKTQFETRFTHAHYLGFDQLAALEPMLRGMKLLGTDEFIIGTEKPGEGNMNFVVRVTTDRRSLILKQSRPWVEKYPQIAAPIERVAAEAAYYQLISQVADLRSLSPALLGYDAQNFVIVFEDLGAGSDYAFIYQSGQAIVADEARELLHYLSVLHRTAPNAHGEPFPSNLPLRRLNHEHIFNFPFQPNNGFDLDAIQPGLAALAHPLQVDDVLKAKITALGDLYLGSGTGLVHGDFYPGSWLRTASGIKVIDPEFAHVGHAEFDVGVMTAHLLMAGETPTSIKATLNPYQKQDGFDDAHCTGFCGVEILRRLLGVAQLPLDLDLAEKRALIDLAKKFIHAPASHELF